MKRQLLEWGSRIFTMAALVLLVGMLPFLSGKDPAAAVLRARSAEQLMTEEALTAVRAQLGLGESAWETFWLWFSAAIKGDLGSSWVSGAPVLPSVLSALGVSLTLMAAALFVAALVAALLCVAPVRNGLRGTPKAGSGMLSAALTASPEFLLASILLIIFSVWLGLFPPFGWSQPIHLVLPALALGIPAGGLFGRLLTEVLTTTFREPWVNTWFMSGWSKPRILFAVLARALPPLLPQLGLIVVGLTGGAVAVEQIFTVPGIGRTALGAAASSDLPMLQASLIVLLLLGILAGVLSKVLARLLLGKTIAAKALGSAVLTIKPAKFWWLTPAICALILFLLTVWELGLDPYGANFSRLATPGAQPLAGAGETAWLGADSSGRNVLARLSAGAITTIGLALLCALVSWVIGVLIGLIPGISTGPLEAANAMPPVLAGLIVATILGASSWGAALAVLLVSWAPLAAHSASLKSEIIATPYAQMAPLLGISPRRYLWQTVIPGVAGATFRHTMLRVPGIALAIASLGFLGLGPQPPAADWGLMLADGINYLERAPWVALAPMFALILLSAFAVSASSRKV